MSESSIDMRELLAWYSDSGVDIPLSDEPIDRFEETAAASKQTKAKAPQPSVTTERKAPTTPPVISPQRTELKARTVPDEGAINSARELAARANTLDELKEIVSSFEGCNLKFAAKSSVFCDGTPKSKIMFVGEVPGRDEDSEGLPFVGRAGQLFDKMLASIGIERAAIYMTCVLPWRPPGNKTPTPAEIEICRPFIQRHIELAEPQILVLMGGTPATNLLNSKGSIMSLRGKWLNATIGSHEVDVLPMLHPTYLLSNPAHKSLAWKDLLSLKQKISEHTT